MKTVIGPPMIALSLLTAPALAQDLAPMASAPSAQPSVKDQHFVQGTIQGNLAEIALSELALQRSRQDDVRAFAQRMVADHTTANDALYPLANKDGIHQPEAMNARHAQLATHLASLSDHDTAIRAFTNEINAGQNQEIVAWANTTLPTIQRHDQMAHALQHKPAAAS